MMKRNPFSAGNGSRLGVSLILIGYLVLAVIYSIAVPLAETPDENEHFNYLQHIALTGTLPIMQPVREANATLEAHQPPLLYLVGAALTVPMEMDSADNLEENVCFSFDPDDHGRQNAFFHRVEEWPPQRGVYQVFQLMRCLSVVMGAMTVWLAMMIGRQVIPGDGRFGLLAGALLAFNPQWIHITASLNNDVPTTLLGAAIIYLCILGRQKPSHRIFAGLGILLGLGFLTKFALIAFWPVAILAAFAPYLNKDCNDPDGSGRSSDRAGRRHGEDTSHSQGGESFVVIRNNLKFLISNLLLITVLPILIAGWWYWRNYRLYGDPLMWSVTLAAKGSIIARPSPFTWADLAEFFVTHFQSYWLWFGWLNVKGPGWVYWLFLGVVLTAVIGLLVLLVKRHLAINRWAVGFCGLGTLVIYAALWQYVQTVNWTGYQGRLAFAAAAPIAVLLALGLYSWNQRWLGLAVAAGLFIISALAIPLLIVPAYPRPAIYQPAPDLTRTCIRFANGLQIEAVAAPEAVKPGEDLPVTIYGFGLEDNDNPQAIRVDLVGWEDEIIGQAEGFLTWGAGEIISKTLTLPVAESLPTRAVLQVSMPDQAATSAAGRILEMPLGVETVKIAPARPFRPEPAVRTDVQFGDVLSLIGYDLDEETREITLYWQTVTPMLEDYTTFVHVLDEADNLIGQADGQPGNGRYPTSVWKADEIVADTKTLPTLNGQLVVGVYLLETLTRLPARDEFGNHLVDDQFSIQASE